MPDSSLLQMRKMTVMLFCAVPQKSAKDPLSSMRRRRDYKTLQHALAFALISLSCDSPGNEAAGRDWGVMLCA